MPIDFSLERSRLIRRYPWWGALAMYLKLIEDPTCDTAWTDGDSIGFSPEFWGKLDDDEKLFVMAHEVFHVALQHVNEWRRGTRDGYTWNEAGDYVINLRLKEASFKMPKGCLDNPKFNGMSTEEVYHELTKKPKQPQSGQGQGEPKDGEGQQPGSGGGDQKGQKGKKSGGGGKPQKAPGMGAGDVRPAKASQGQKGEEQEKKWLERMVAAAQVAKMKGNLPGGIEEMLKHLLYPKVPWTTYLSRLLNESFPEDWDWTHFDRRWISQNLYLPSEHCYKVKIAVAVDTSGSMSDETLAQCLSELWDILQSKMVTEARFLQADMVVTFDEILTPHDAMPLKVYGRGGTSFCPIFKRLEDYDHKVLLYFTDLMGDFPKHAPDYPVWWITETKGVKVPFGEVIEM